MTIKKLSKAIDLWEGEESVVPTSDIDLEFDLSPEEKDELIRKDKERIDKQNKYVDSVLDLENEANLSKEKANEAVFDDFFSKEKIAFKKAFAQYKKGNFFIAEKLVKKAQTAAQNIQNNQPTLEVPQNQNQEKSEALAHMESSLKEAENVLKSSQNLNANIKTLPLDEVLANLNIDLKNINDGIFSIEEANQKKPNVIKYINILNGLKQNKTSSFQKKSLDKSAQEQQVLKIETEKDIQDKKGREFLNFWMNAANDFILGKDKEANSDEIIKNLSDIQRYLQDKQISIPEGSSSYADMLIRVNTFLRTVKNKVEENKKKNTTLNMMEVVKSSKNSFKEIFAEYNNKNFETVSKLVKKADEFSMVENLAEQGLATGVKAQKATEVAQKQSLVKQILAKLSNVIKVGWGKAPSPASLTKLGQTIISKVPLKALVTWAPKFLASAGGVIGGAVTTAAGIVSIKLLMAFLGGYQMGEIVKEYIFDPLGIDIQGAIERNITTPIQEWWYNVNRSTSEAEKEILENMVRQVKIEKPDLSDEQRLALVKQRFEAWKNRGGRVNEPGKIVKDKTQQAPESTQSPAQQSEQQSTQVPSKAIPTPVQQKSQAIKFMEAFRKFAPSFKKDTGEDVMLTNEEVSEVVRSNSLKSIQPKIDRVKEYQKRVASSLETLYKTAQQKKPEFKIDGLWGPKSRARWQAKNPKKNIEVTPEVQQQKVDQQLSQLNRVEPEIVQSPELKYLDDMISYATSIVNSTTHIPSYTISETLLKVNELRLKLEKGEIALSQQIQPKKVIMLKNLQKLLAEHFRASEQREKQ